MRISVPHNRSKEEVIKSIERSMNQLFQEAAALPVKLVVEQRSWQGSTMTFLITARMGILSTPIKGNVEVTDQEVIVNVDLGLFGRMVAEKDAQRMIGSRLKGMLT